jgi:hypothetical protein
MDEQIEAEGHRVYRDWVDRVVEEDRAAIPSGPLWHYSSPAGVLGVLDSQRLWATQTWFLNDATETRHGMQLFMDVLGSVDLTTRSAHTRLWVEKWLYEAAGDALHGWLDKNLSLFVACFCEDGDLLSQWRSYGNDAAATGGFALGFNFAPMHAWAQAAGHGMYLHRVIYDEAEQRRICAELIESSLDFLDRNDSEQGRESFIRHLVDGIGQVSAWFKHNSFREEAEWRVIYPRTEDMAKLNLKFRPGRGAIIPYVELDLTRRVGAHVGLLPISHINIGPQQDHALARRGLEVLIAERRLDVAEIHESVAPLRTL